MPAQVRVFHSVYGSGWTDALLRKGPALVEFDRHGWLKVDISEIRVEVV